MSAYPPSVQGAQVYHTVSSLELLCEMEDAALVQTQCNRCQGSLVGDGSFSAEIIIIPPRVDALHDDIVDDDFDFPDE